MGKTVFLSTTTKELREHRRVVCERLKDLPGWRCVRIEDFSDRNLPLYVRCKEEIESCDLFVGVIGHCYGEVLPRLKKSHTEAEYHWADSAGIERLIFLAPDSFLMRANIREPDDRWQKQQLFRNWVRTTNRCIPFNSSTDLAYRVVVALRNWEQEQQALHDWKQERRARSTLKLNEATLETELMYHKQLPTQPIIRSEDRIQTIAAQIVAALLAQTMGQLTTSTHPFERSPSMDPQAIAPFVPIIVEATKFVFNEVSKWIEEVREKTPYEAPKQEAALALPITEAQFSETQANLQAMAALMNSTVAQANAFVIQSLVGNIQQHRKNIARLETRKVMLGVSAPIALDTQIEDEAKGIVEKTARLVALLDQVYRKDT